MNNSFLQVEVRRPLHLLTRRECEVLQLLADEKTRVESVKPYSLVKKPLKTM